jgi:hypothetical protein
MDAVAEIAFEAGGRSLRIIPHGELDPAAGPYDDTVQATILVDAGAFAGSFTTCIYPVDLRSARHVLQTLSEQVGGTEPMSFAFLERGIEMTFKPTRLGNLSIDVRCNVVTDDGPSLHFTMEADQSYLPKWSAAIDAVLPQPGKS